jgi:predicted transcriptional regulator
MKLKEYLDKKNLIHSRFAEKCGLKRSAFCRYVNGDRKPDPVTCMKIKAMSKGEVTEFNKIIADHLDLILNNSST